MRTNSIGFIGGGRITKILLQAYKNKSIRFDSIKVYEPNEASCKSLNSQFPEIEIVESAENAASQNIIFIAVHPPIVIETLNKIKTATNGATTVISLAPKITLEKMAAILPTSNLVRMIPNATTYINRGYNPVSFDSRMDKAKCKETKKLFKPFGKTLIRDESKLESYAIVSAMLPNYFWFQWQEMEAIALETGLNQSEAKKTIKSTLTRAIKLFYNSKLSYEEVMDLIPVKPIGENEEEIRNILHTKLVGLYGKIKP